jgi:hypothetical protein
MLLSFSYAIKLTLAKSPQTLSTPPQADRNQKRKRSQEFEDPFVCAPAKRLQTSVYDANANQLGSYFLGMADSSRLEISKSKPIGEGLAVFRDAFRSTCADLGIPKSADSVQQIIDKGECSNLEPSSY